MNISTNYSKSSMLLNSTQPQNVRNYNSQPFYLTQKTNDKNINFTGLNIGAIKSKLFGPPKYSKAEFNDLIDYASTVLRKDESDISKILKGKPTVRINFFHRLIDRYNSFNFDKPDCKKESSQLVFDIFEKFEKPTKNQVQFIDNVNLNIADMKKSMEIFSGKDEKLPLLSSISHIFSRYCKTKNITSDIVNSKNVEEYVSNFDSYKDYIIANIKDENIIKTLDKKISEGLFDADYNKKTTLIKKALSHFPENPVLTKEALLKSYSEKGNDILYNISCKFSPTEESLNKGDAKAILGIYKSTTPQNLEFRNEFIDRHYLNFGERNRYSENEIEDLGKLFNILDKDKNAMKFVSGLMDANATFQTASSYLKLIEEFGSEKLASNLKKSIKTIQKSRYKSFDNLRNTLSGVGGKGSFVDKILNLFTKKAEAAKPQYEDTFVKLDEIPIIEPKEIEPSLSEIKFEPIIKIDKQEKISKIKKTPIYIPNKSLAEVNKAKLSDLLTNSTSKTMSKKLKIAQKDVSPILKRNIKSEKILSEQEYLYTIKATKMRANMLPEIFASIKETRTAAKANGTFNKSKTVSNEDAIDLYTRINGKNKKLVNYMLKVRNADGTRKFSVKDIIDTLAEGNRAVLKRKNLSTKTERFTAKDEKAIYDTMLAEKVEQYGNLPRTKRK